MSNHKLDITGFRSKLGWSQRKLSETLEVAELTVQRWEKKQSETEEEGAGLESEGANGRPAGRPSQIPPFLRFALDYLLLREGKKKEPVEVRLALPNTVGGALPFLAKDNGLFKEQDLRVTIATRDTGTEALEDVFRDYADVAGAAEGLLTRYQESIIDMGVVMRSVQAFKVLSASRRGTASDRDSVPSVLHWFDEFKSSIILYPKGSDLDNLLFSLRNEFYDKKEEQPTPRAVERREAIDLLKEAADISAEDNAQRTLYVAWEPLASKIKEEVEKNGDIHVRSHPIAARALEKVLRYEFHLVCSKKWSEANPAAVFDFLTALARADLAFDTDRVASLQKLSENYGLLGTEDSAEQANERYQIRFEPSTHLFRLFSRDKLIVLDRGKLNGGDSK